MADVFPTPRPLPRVPLSSVELGGWMRAGARAALDGYVGQLPRLAPEVGGDVFVSGRLGRGAEAVNAEQVAWWNGESEGNWLSAWLAHVLLVGTEAERHAAADRVRRIVGSQDDDGYLGMFAKDERAAGGFVAGDLWTRTCLLRALRTWADATGDVEVHGAIDRAVAAIARQLERQIADGSAFARVRGTGHDLMVVDLLADAFVRSGEARYRTLAAAVYEAYSRGDLDAVFADHQRARLESDEPFSGHGAHVAEHARVPLLIAVMHGDTADAGPWRELFDRSARKLAPALGASGGLRSDETLGAPGRDPVHLAEAGEEMCALTELAATAVVAADATGDPAWLDRVEAIFLNAHPAGIRQDGTAVAYLHAENQDAASRAQGTRWDYSPTHDDAAVCCAPNAGRMIEVVARRAVIPVPDGVRVDLYGPLSVGVPGPRGEVRLTQITDFPFEEEVGLLVEAEPGPLVVELRVPGWCTDPDVEVDGDADVHLVRVGAYLRISGRWARSVRVRLRMPHRVRLVETRDGRAAVAAGPLVFAQEIPHRDTPTRTYAGSALVDVDVTSVEDPSRRGPVLRASNVRDARVVRAPGRRDHAAPGVVVRVDVMDPSPRAKGTTGAEDQRIDLVPIGATTLRRTVFPVIRD
ncbi:beta-L-arabinofuranosidase domain-containing protein [Microbacterium chocolatum]|uniref:beta-L-arabinofuranosidase domain-containing protein n=1 Tax=Microbacterium aurantiacum TaxID=162393 RepID=UPI00338FA1FC